MHQDKFKDKIVPISNKMFRLALRLLQNTDDAKDALQDVYITLWSKREMLEQIKNLEGYAMQTIKNKCLDRLRSRKNMYSEEDQILDIEEKNTNPHMHLENKQYIEVLNNLVDKLPPVQRMVFQLRDIEDYSYEEIQEIMKIEISTLRVNLFKARTKIRAQFKMHYHESGKN